MSANYALKVPKLEGLENYDEWSFAAENFLILDGLLKYVKPMTTDEIVEQEDAKCMAKLILSMDPAIFVHIKQAKLEKLENVE